MRGRGRHNFGDDFVLLSHLHFFSFGDPTQNFRPLLGQLLNTGGFHAAKMPRNSLWRKTAFANREAEGVLLVRKAGEMLYHLTQQPKWAGGNGK